MRVYRPTRKDPATGKRLEYEVWYVEFRDHQETVRRLPGFTDHKATEQFGRNVEKLIAVRSNGDTPDVVLGRWLESLPAKLRTTLCRMGLLDARSVAAGKPLSDHVAEFEAALRAKGNTEKHCKLSANRLRALFDGCGFRVWSDIRAGKVERWLSDRREGTAATPSLSRQSTNYYLTGAKSFGKWMVRERLASESPVEHLRPLNAKADRRHDRRELSVDEVRRLLRATYHGPTRACMDGPERSLIYRLAVESGLRANELRSLTRGSFDFRATTATVTVEAGASKRRRRDTLPLRRDTAAELQAHLALTLPTAAAFGLPSSDKTSRMIQGDLAAARAAWLAEAATVEEKAEREQSSFLAYVDDSGRYADFHALRHSFLSNLARSGVHPKLAQALARHSTITLTMDRYSHTVLGEQSEAVESLPSMAGATDLPAAATGTDGRPATAENRVALCVPKRDAEPCTLMHFRAVSGQSTQQLPLDEKTPENTVFTGVSAVETSRGAGGSRTLDDGFAIRCPPNRNPKRQTDLATNPKTLLPFLLPERFGNRPRNRPPRRPPATTWKASSRPSAGCRKANRPKSSAGWANRNPTPA